MTDRKHYEPHRFDFEVGHLKKSPCKTCHDRYRFPSCIDLCTTLDHVQRRLARTVITSCTHSPMENFSILIDSRGEK